MNIEFNIDIGDEAGSGKKYFASYTTIGATVIPRIDECIEIDELLGPIRVENVIYDLQSDVNPVVVKLQTVRKFDITARDATAAVLRSEGWKIELLDDYDNALDTSDESKYHMRWWWDGLTSTDAIDEVVDLVTDWAEKHKLKIIGHAGPQDSQVDDDIPSTKATCRNCSLLFGPIDQCTGEVKCSVFRKGKFNFKCWCNEHSFYS